MRDQNFSQSLVGLSFIFKGLVYVLTPFLTHNFYAEEGYNILIETLKSTLF